MNFETLNVAFRAGIVTKRQPAAQNAMNTAMMRELRDCLVFTGDATRGVCTAPNSSSAEA
jgi:enoyl-CoA hydratase/carnithine racemase